MFNEDLEIPSERKPNMKLEILGQDQVYEEAFWAIRNFADLALSIDKIEQMCVKKRIELTYRGSQDKMRLDFNFREGYSLSNRKQVMNINIFKINETEVAFQFVKIEGSAEEFLREVRGVKFLI